MPTRSAFLQAILAAPDDDAPRLIYADWLEERGDPRGEFIRLQVAAARLPFESPQRRELECGAAALLQKYELEWLGPLRQRLQRWYFRRGFVERIALPALNLLTCGPEIWEWEPVHSVDLTNLANFGTTVAQLEQLAYLRRLSIGWNPVGDEGVLPFADSTRLERLESLSLWHCLIGDETAVALARSRQLSRLRTLDVSNNHIRSSGAMIMARSRFLQHITHLRVYGNPIGVDAVHELRMRFGHRLTMF